MCIFYNIRKHNLMKNFIKILNIFIVNILHMCAKHGAFSSGASPLLALSMGITSLGKGVHREVKSEGS